MNNSPGLLKILGVIGTCAAICVVLGSINIWLGILSMPILYGIGESFLSD